MEAAKLAEKEAANQALEIVRQAAQKAEIEAANQALEIVRQAAQKAEIVDRTAKEAILHEITKLLTGEDT